MRLAKAGKHHHMPMRFNHLVTELTKRQTNSHVDVFLNVVNPTCMIQGCLRKLGHNEAQKRIQNRFGEWKNNLLNEKNTPKMIGATMLSPSFGLTVCVSLPHFVPPSSDFPLPKQ